MKEKVMNCSLCDRKTRFTVIAVRVVDGDLLDDIDCCRKHALELALGGGDLSITITSRRLGTQLDQCYRDGCSCLPANLDRCARCTRLADVWLTGGTDEDLFDLDRGILLCGPCAFVELDNDTLPVELRREMRNAVKC
jgi:hypothetical protein